MGIPPNKGGRVAAASVSLPMVLRRRPDHRQATKTPLAAATRTLYPMHPTGGGIPYKPPLDGDLARRENFCDFFLDTGGQTTIIMWSYGLF
jgi:hypothetical protein